MTTNNDKILKALEKEKESITTTELANKTRIDIRNITRYLKPLENKGIITRKIIQEGKIRVVKVELNKEKTHPPIAPKLMPKLHPPKKVVLTQEEKALVTIGKGNDFLKTKPPIKKVVPQGESQNEISDYINKVIYNQAISSDDKRHRYYVITGKTWRGTNQGLDLALYRYYKEIEEYREFKRDTPIIVKTITEEYKRGNMKDRRALIKELEESLAKRKANIKGLT